ncbi:hypothetical protein TNIN_449091 [Trichonephila inaurata madagascariensis]|uniref:Uncharacterized protein n=1 Tax=Trichonephila inaurata madagascariensis TaxID=2747483 RepID=A0A8X7CE58_9ARAC|nr:hypothetical protein TNIN_449091 [Trichonephila inaurata madagascariensis]
MLGRNAPYMKMNNSVSRMPTKSFDKAPQDHERETTLVHKQIESHKDSFKKRIAPLINTTYFHPFPCRSKRLHFPINLSVTAEPCVLEDSVRKSDITERTKTHFQNVWKK